MNLRNYRLRDYDFKLILFTLALSVIGVFAISSAMGEAGADNVKKQIGGIIVGTVFMIVISLIDYHFILKFWIPIYAFTLLVLFFVIFGGETTKDFAFALLVGFASGCYSSIFIASPIWITLRNRADKKRVAQPAEVK